MKISKNFLLENQYDGIYDYYQEINDFDEKYGNYLIINKLNRLDNKNVYMVIYDKWSVALYGINSGFNYCACSKAGTNCVDSIQNWAKQSGFKIVEEPKNTPHDDKSNKYTSLWTEILKFKRENDSDKAKEYANKIVDTFSK